MSTKNIQKQKRFVTTAELCQRYGNCVPLTIYRRVRRGLLPRPWKLSPGAGLLFDLDAIEAMEARAQDKTA